MRFRHKVAVSVVTTVFAGLPVFSQPPAALGPDPVTAPAPSVPAAQATSTANSGMEVFPTQPPPARDVRTLPPPGSILGGANILDESGGHQLNHTGSGILGPFQYDQSDRWLDF